MKILHNPARSSRQNPTAQTLITKVEWDYLDRLRIAHAEQREEQVEAAVLSLEVGRDGGSKAGWTGLGLVGKRLQASHESFSSSN